MAVLQKSVVIVLAAGVLAGCSRPARMRPLQPPIVRHGQEKAQYNYEHKLAPEPGYVPKDIDALARQLSGIARRPPAASAAAPTVIVGRIAIQPRVSTRQRHRPTRPAGWRGDHYLNTLFWGGLGAVIGHQSGEAGKGAIIGAAYGHALDHGGLHGLLSPGTIMGGAMGALFSGNRGKGALYGAAAGHLLDDVFRRSKD